MFLKWLRITLALLIISTNVEATTYHVRHNGNDGQSGTSWSNAWRTIQKANDNAMPGDIIYVYDGTNQTYSTFPNPVNAGVASNEYITFIGASLDGDPLADSLLRSKVRVRDGTLTKDYVSIKGMSFAGFQIDGGDRDSVINNIMIGGLWYPRGDYNYYAENIHLGNPNGTDVVQLARLDGMRLKGLNMHSNRFWNLRAGNAAGFLLGKHSTTASCDTAIAGVVDSSFFYWNHIQVEKAGPSGCWVIYEMNNTKFKYNFWDITNNFNTNYAVGWRGRIRNSEIGDTIFIKGTGGTDIYFHNGAYDGGACNSDVMVGINVDSSYIQTPGSFDFKTRLNNFKMTRTAMITGGGRALQFSATTDFVQPSLFDHNTLVGPSTEPVVWLDPETEWRVNGPINLLTFTNNIVGNHSPTGATWETCKADEDNDGEGEWSGMQDWGVSWNDSAGKWNHRLTTNNNLYFTRAKTTTAGDRSIAIYNQSTDWVCDAPGSSNALDDANTVNSKHSVAGGDSVSIYGNPKFNKGKPQTYSPTVLYDVNIGYGSPAIGAGSGGSTIGAYTLGVFGTISFPDGSQRFLKAVAGDTCGVVIQNVGPGDLEITQITADQPLLYNWANNVLTPGEFRHLTITNASNDGTSRSALVTVHCNDAKNPRVYIQIDISDMDIYE